MKTIKVLEILVPALSLILCPAKVMGYTDAVSRIVAGQDDQIAAESLQGYLLEQFNAQIDIVDPNETGSGGEGCEILLGTQATNPYLAQIALEHNVDIDPTNLTEDGYVLQTLQHQERDVVLAAGGGKRGVFYTVGELKNYYLRQVGDSVVVLLADVCEVPALKYRWFWTWDYRMEWDGVDPGPITGAYLKEPESFLADYKACINYMSENGLNGLIIWGFLRNSHGGIPYAQEISSYAAERGVRVLPGVGTCTYGGYYLQGDHLYNMYTWISQHPELEADIIYRDQPLHGCACPSKQANQDWLQDGAEWLFENFQVGGVNLEAGDLFVCHCNDCNLARAAIDCNYPDHLKDIAICQGPLIEAMLQLDPNAWLSYTIYIGFTTEMMTTIPKFIEMIPSEAICLWMLTHMMGPGQWPPSLKPMTENSIGHLHWASKTPWNDTHHDFFLEGLRTAANKAHLADMEGLAIYGELLDSRPNMKLNYLAFREYCFHPNLSQEEFTAKRLAPLYGWGLTDDLWEVINLVRTAAQRAPDENIATAMTIAKAALEIAPDYARENWQAMVAYIQSFRHRPWPYECDLIKDGYIDWVDVAAFAEQWLNENCQAANWCEGADLDRLGSVDLTDFILLVQHWLTDVPIPPPNLVGWWALDETSGITAADASGNNKNGTLQNGLNFTNDSVEGRIGNALHFDGVDDKVLVSALSLPSDSGVTIAMWFNPDVTLNPGTGRVDFTYWAVSGGLPNLTMVDSGEISFRCHLEEYPSVFKVSTTTNSWTAGTWYHIAGTYDGFELKIYVDGNLENTLYSPGTHRSTYGFYFGNYFGYWSVPFDGKIDDVRIYDGALSEEEIANLAK